MSLEINGENIDDEIISEEYQFRLEEYQKAGTLPPDSEELLTLVKEEIVLKTLLRQEVEKIDFKISEPQLKAEIKYFQEWNPKAAEMSSQDLEEYVSFKLKEEKLIDQLMEDTDRPTDVHLKIFYQDNQIDYTMAKKYRVLMKRPPETDLELVGYEEELTPEGKELVEDLKNQIYKTFYQPIPIFKPFQSSGYSSKSIEDFSKATQTSHSISYLLVEMEDNFLPPLEDIKSWVEADLLEEMRKIKLELYLRKVMKESTIKDNVYLG